MYVHGTGSSGKGATKRLREWQTSIVQGHIHTEAFVDWYSVKDKRMFAMQVGCGVDDQSYAMADPDSRHCYGLRSERGWVMFSSHSGLWILINGG